MAVPSQDARSMADAWMCNMKVVQLFHKCDARLEIRHRVRGQANRMWCSHQAFFFFSLYLKFASPWSRQQTLSRSTFFLHGGDPDPVPRCDGTKPAEMLKPWLRSMNLWTGQTLRLSSTPRWKRLTGSTRRKSWKAERRMTSCTVC